MRLGLVDLPRQLDELGIEVLLTRLEREVKRVDRKTVAPHPRTRIKTHEPERFRGGGVDDLPDVDSETVAELCQFIDKGDVHGTKDVLQKLCQLRRLGTRQDDDLIADFGVQ